MPGKPHRITQGDAVQLDVHVGGHIYTAAGRVIEIHNGTAKVDLGNRIVEAYVSQLRKER